MRDADAPASAPASRLRPASAPASPAATSSRTTTLLRLRLRLAPAVRLILRLQVLHEYKRLLTLKALELDLEGTRIAGSPALTAMWQQHVLDTAAYAACCTALCGSLCVAMSKARPVGPASAYAYQAADWPRLTEARGTA